MWRLTSEYFRIWVDRASLSFKTFFLSWEKVSKIVDIKISWWMKCSYLLLKLKNDIVSIFKFQLKLSRWQLFVLNVFNWVVITFHLFFPQIEVLVLYLDDERCISNLFIIHAFYFLFDTTGDFFGKFQFFI